MPDRGRLARTHWRPRRPLGPGKRNRRLSDSGLRLSSLIGLIAFGLPAGEERHVAGNGIKRVVLVSHVLAQLLQVPLDRIEFSVPYCDCPYETSDGEEERQRCA